MVLDISIARSSRDDLGGIYTSTFLLSKGKDYKTDVDVKYRELKDHVISLVDLVDTNDDYLYPHLAGIAKHDIRKALKAIDVRRTRIEGAIGDFVRYEEYIQVNIKDVNPVHVAKILAYLFSEEEPACLGRNLFKVNEKTGEVIAEYILLILMGSNGISSSFHHETFVGFKEED